jgi:hypothetical protein
MARMIDVVPNKGGGISSSSPFLVFGVRHGDFDACRHLRLSFHVGFFHNLLKRMSPRSPSLDGSSTGGLIVVLGLLV